MLLTWTGTTIVVWSLVLEIFGRLDKEGRKVLKSWKFIPNLDKFERKLLSKFGKGCRPVIFGLEGLLTIKRDTVIKYYATLIKRTFRALLTLGKR